MSVIPVDILLKTMLEAAIADLRANPWLLQDVFSALENDTISEADYGHKEVAQATDWFISNNIPVYMQHRIDQPTFPSLVIVDTGSSELAGRRTSLADDGHTEDFDPTMSQPTILYTYPPFTPKGYDPVTGTVTFPGKIKTDIMVPGQLLVSIRSGKSYPILQVTGGNTFKIAVGVADDFTQAYITTSSPLWNQQREQTYFSHSFAIFAASVSDSVQANWLWQILVYALLRYKEAYLEGRGAEVSTFQSGPLTRASEFEPEAVYYRQVSLVLDCEVSWIKYIAPRFEQVRGGLVIKDGPRTPPNYQEEVYDQAWRMEGDDPVTAGVPIPVGQGDIDLPIVPDGEYEIDDTDGEND